jgi:hypothetical protein
MEMPSPALVLRLGKIMLGWLTTGILLLGGDATLDARGAVPAPVPFGHDVELHPPSPWDSGPALGADDDDDDGDDDPDSEETLRIKKDNSQNVLDSVIVSLGLDPGPDAELSGPVLSSHAPLFLRLRHLRN